MSRSLQHARINRRGRPLAGAAALVISVANALASAPVPAAAPQEGALEKQDEESFAPALFQLYDTQAARAIALEVTEHIEGERWPEAVAGLQSLIEDHEGEVLGASRPVAEGMERPSETAVHAGAGAWAVARLFELPPEAKEVYRRRFGARAEAALSRALRAGDRGALTRLAERWPITESAATAWWALGDLEAELGHGGDALRAWARASGVALGRARARVDDADAWRALRADLEATLEPDSSLATGALARADFALEILPTLENERSSRGRDEATFVRGPATRVAAARLDASDGKFSPRARNRGADEWPQPFVLPDGPFWAKGGAGRIFPQRFGDTVIVNTSRSVHALDAFDGTERWRFDESQLTWDRMTRSELREYSEAVDAQERIVTVAASRGVVVAPLQIPIKFQRSKDFHDLTIIEVIPERRLVAFDAETGEPLWNTLPPKDWDGDSGSFAERMTVVGPPTVVGARVLVPMARLRGRVELHLGCFDLGTGDVLWSAPLVTGQRELNMFGRATAEFSAPPPVVAGDTVVMLTQLGLVAAVDLFTGEVLWDTVYEQVAIHGPRYYEEGWMDNAWRNAPPVVHGDTVVAAPQDGRSLIGVDLETGSLLWSLDQVRIAGRAGVTDYRRRRGRGASSMELIGADKRRAYFGGHRVFSVLFEKGLRRGTNSGGGAPSWRIDWAWPSGRNSLASEYGYPVIDEDSIFVPRGSSLTRLERSTGRELENVEGKVGSGQLLVSRGMLFTVNGREVLGRFDWLAMVDRARARAKDGDPRDAAVFARLLLERERWSLDAGEPPSGAVELAREARGALEGRGARDAQSDGAVRARAGELRETLLRALFLEARAERLRGAHERALELVDDAIQLSDGAEAELDAQLVRYALLRERAPIGEQQAALSSVTRAGRGRDVVVEARAPKDRWSAESAYLSVLNAVESGVATGLRSPAWTDPWRGALTPRVASLAAGDATGLTTARLGIDVFVAIENVRLARLQGGDTGLALELEALHQLAGRSDVELFGTTAGLWSTARIRSLRAMAPEAPAFAAIEARASAVLARAIEDAERGGATDALDAVSVDYPGSAAALRADTLRVEYALENGSAEDIASIVIGALPGDWSAASASERELRQLARLALAMGRSGNRALEQGLLESLAHVGPGVAISSATAPGQPSTIAEALTAARASATELQRTPPPPSFTNDAIPMGTLDGTFVGVATVVDPTDGAALGIFATNDLLAAIPAGAKGIPRWQARTKLPLNTSDRTDHVFVSDEVIVVGERDEVVGLEIATGETRWEYQRASRTVRNLTLADGVVVATLGGPTASDPIFVYGIDAAQGIELWRLGPINRRYSPQVIAGDGVAAFLPSQGTTAELHDLFTGHLVAVAEVGRVAKRHPQFCWIADGRLVIPVPEGAFFREFDNAIKAFDVRTGQPAWRIELDRVGGTRRALLGILDMPTPTGRVRHALLETVLRSNSDKPASGAFDLIPIDEAQGQLVPASRLHVDGETHLAGVPRREYVRLDAPLLIALSETRRGRSTRIRAYGPDLGKLFDAPYGRNIAVAGAERLGAPIVGDRTIALLVREALGRGATLAFETKLAFIDLETGAPIESRSLASRNERSNASAGARLFPFGGSIAVSKPRSMGILEPR